MRKVDVCGVAFTVEQFDDHSRSDGALGRCDSKTGTIKLSNTMSDDVAISTLVHEWVHAVLDINGIPHEEIIAGVLGNELYRNGFRVPISVNENDPVESIAERLKI